MKKILIPVGALLLSGLANAQNQSSTTENFVYTKTYLDYNGTTATKTSETVQYFDGLGRPKQVVNVKASPQGKDVVTHIEYDGFGRQVKDYLPVPQQGTQNGGIYTSPLSNATQPNLYGSEKIFSEKILENSPLDRILQQKQVGTAWDTKPVQFGYDANTTADEVKKYTTVTTWENGATKSTITQSTVYGDAQLYKNTVADEDGNQTIEFKNGEGQVLLVRKMLNATEKADTYYVYNEYNQLTFVIPPLADISGDTDETTLNNLCYQYKYDGRNRLVEKKLPGKGWEYMVYDKQDRLVMTQDANMGSTKQWLFTKYDQYGRVAYTGIYTSSANYDGQGRASEQANVDSRGSNNVTRSAAIGFNNSNMNVYYDNSASSSYPNTITKLLSINYYDTYPSGSPAATNVFAQSLLTDNAANGISTKGLPVANYVKNIENDGWTRNYTWYDTKGRVIGVHSVNYLGGYTKTETLLDFAGIPQKTNTYHKRDGNMVEVQVKERFVYNAQNMLLKHYHQVDNNAEELLTENSYNEKSQLINKKVGNNLQSIDYAYNIRGWMTGINPAVIASMENKLFGYDIRYQNPTNTQLSPARYNGNISEVNWRTTANGILKRYAYQYDGLNRLTKGTFLNPDNAEPESKWNNETVNYDINGNITRLRRNAKSFYNGNAELIDDLVYEYSGNQLMSVNDKTDNPTGYEGGGNPMEYDANGNMKTMPDKQIHTIGYNHLNLPNALKIEENKKKMIYLYRADGTKLRKTFNFLKQDGSVYTTITDYLDGFQYLSTAGNPPNELDPIEYAYEQESFIKEAAVKNPTPTLNFFPTAEGFYDYEKKEYIYQYKDHLGNVRVSYKKIAGGIEITDQNDYYPFGMNIPREEKAVFGKSSLYNYKYSGKELQETGMYDYGARFYMPDIGRWGVVDPAAELGRRFSPYNYAFDNPIMFVDPDGMWPWPTWNQVKKFASGYAKGAWSTAGNMVKGVATSTYTGITGGFREAKKVYNAYQTGGAKAAAKQYVNSVYETSGAKAIVETAKGVAKGDAESIGSAVVTVVAAVVTHKAAGGKVATATEAETASVSKTVTVTQESVTQALQDSNLQTAQGVVSGPMVERYVQMAQDGNTAPPIKVTSDGVIVDGNHRYVAGKLTGNEPAQVPGTLSPSQQSKVQPVQNTKVDPNDWGGH
ncbi:RHS repeat-associated core domain-containing protein [Chryseobacterium taichungense]|uniref:RHS repeat-associated core domain-containing protein n=1 Tax=Chryseobacterium taichungense TaxID=295069 RepID=A0A1H8AEE4_9FLAO|nr:DUF6443 domain-containing protein [Chryseobacterium taichungense]SEM68208.1 RHS repeat-associated core domain-containing protein [Chryseobacterium taichungense]